MPDSILLCPAELGEEQLLMMRRHPLLSVRIMERMEFLEQEIPAVRYHHERYDGKGYPEGIAGAAIPLTARILAVADAFDALTSQRTFRKALSLQQGLDEIKRGVDAQFDPVVVEAFLAVAARLGDKLMDMSQTSQSSAWREDPAEQPVAAAGPM
jgi:HD-GYP domain-containing protein (c-di-GMP phosphodiesterase class II)